MSHVSWQENQFEQTGCNSSGRIVDYVSHRRIWVFELSHSIKFDEIVLRNKTIENDLDPLNNYNKTGLVTCDPNSSPDWLIAGLIYRLTR